MRMKPYSVPSIAYCLSFGTFILAIEAKNLTGFHRDPFISFNGESPYQTCDSPIKEEGDPVDPVSTPRGGRNGAGTEILGQLFTFIILKSWPKISQFRHAFLPPLHFLFFHSSLLGTPSYSLYFNTQKRKEM